MLKKHKPWYADARVTYLFSQGNKNEVAEVVIDFPWAAINKKIRFSKSAANFKKLNQMADLIDCLLNVLPKENNA